EIRNAVRANPEYAAEHNRVDRQRKQWTDEDPGRAQDRSSVQLRQRLRRKKSQQPPITPDIAQALGERLAARLDDPRVERRGGLAGLGCHELPSGPNCTTKRTFEHANSAHIDGFERIAADFSERLLRETEVIREVIPIGVERDGTDAAERGEIG